MHSAMTIVLSTPCVDGLYKQKAGYPAGVHEAGKWSRSLPHKQASYADLQAILYVQPSKTVKEATPHKVLKGPRRRHMEKSIAFNTKSWVFSQKPVVGVGVWILHKEAYVN